MLADEKILNIEKVVKKTAYECFTFIAYKQDLNKLRENEYRRNKI